MTPYEQATEHLRQIRNLRAVIERLSEDRDYWRDRALAAENMADAP